MVRQTAASANNTTRLITNNGTGLRATLTAVRVQYARVRSARGSPMPRLAATTNTGGSNVTVATNPMSTAMAHAGPDVAKMFNVAKVIDSKANATVAADASITRPIVAVAWTTASSTAILCRRCS